MENCLERLVKSKEDIKKDILSDFADDFYGGVEKLLNIYAKEDLMKMLSIIGENDEKIENNFSSDSS